MNFKLCFGFASLSWNSSIVNYLISNIGKRVFFNVRLMNCSKTMRSFAILLTLSMSSTAGLPRAFLLRSSRKTFSIATRQVKYTMYPNMRSILPDLSFKMRYILRPFSSTQVVDSNSNNSLIFSFGSLLLYKMKYAVNFSRSKYSQFKLVQKKFVCWRKNYPK